MSGNIRSQIICESIGKGATVRSLVDLDTLLSGKCKDLVKIKYTIQSENNPPKRIHMILTDTLPTGKSDANLGDFLGVNDQIFTVTEGVTLAGAWETHTIEEDEIKQAIRLYGFKYLVLIADAATLTNAYNLSVALFRSSGVDKRVDFVQSA